MINSGVLKISNTEFPDDFFITFCVYITSCLILNKKEYINSILIKIAKVYLILCRFVF